jgi:hypothetical protein
VKRIVREAAKREFGRIGQADDDRASLLEISYDRRVGGSDNVHLRGCPVGVGPPFVIHVFLDGDRHAVQQAKFGAFCTRLVGGFRRLKGFL